MKWMEVQMSQPVGLECLNCGKLILATYDVTKDVEIKCSNCGSVTVAPRNGGKPFLKKPEKS